MTYDLPRLSQLTTFLIHAQVLRQSNLTRIQWCTMTLVPSWVGGLNRQLIKELWPPSTLFERNFNIGLLPLTCPWRPDGWRIHSAPTNVESGLCTRPIYVPFLLKVSTSSNVISRFSIHPSTFWMGVLVTVNTRRPSIRVLTSQNTRISRTLHFRGDRVSKFSGIEGIYNMVLSQIIDYWMVEPVILDAFETWHD